MINALMLHSILNLPAELESAAPELAVCFSSPDSSVVLAAATGCAPLNVLLTALDGEPAPSPRLSELSGDTAAESGRVASVFTDGPCGERRPCP